MATRLRFDFPGGYNATLGKLRAKDHTWADTYVNPPIMDMDPADFYLDIHVDDQARLWVYHPLIQDAVYWNGTYPSGVPGMLSIYGYKPRFSYYLTYMAANFLIQFAGTPTTIPADAASDPPATKDLLIYLQKALPHSPVVTGVGSGYCSLISGGTRQDIRPWWSSSPGAVFTVRKHNPADPYGTLVVGAGLFFNFPANETPPWYGGTIIFDANDNLILSTHYDASLNVGGQWQVWGLRFKGTCSGSRDSLACINDLGAGPIDANYPISGFPGVYNLFSASSLAAALHVSRDDGHTWPDYARPAGGPIGGHGPFRVRVGSDTAKAGTGPTTRLYADCDASNLAFPEDDFGLQDFGPGDLLPGRTTFAAPAYADRTAEGYWCQWKAVGTIGTAPNPIRWFELFVTKYNCLDSDLYPRAFALIVLATYDTSDPETRTRLSQAAWEKELLHHNEASGLSVHDFDCTGGQVILYPSTCGTLQFYTGPCSDQPPAPFNAALPNEWFGGRYQGQYLAWAYHTRDLTAGVGSPGPIPAGYDGIAIDNNNWALATSLDRPGTGAASGYGDTWRKSCKWWTQSGDRYTYVTQGEGVLDTTAPYSNAAVVTIPVALANTWSATWDELVHGAVGTFDLTSGATTIQNALTIETNPVAPSGCTPIVIT